MAMTKTTRIRQLTEWALHAAYADFDSGTIDKAKGLLLKTVAGMVAGAREPVGKIVTNYFAEQGGAPIAGVVAGGYRTTVENAAFANATFAHASELEDNELPSITSAYWMFPALFPLAQKYVSNGREIIESAIVAWDVGSRFCRTAPGAYAQIYGAMPPSWWNGFGVVAAAARMGKLNIDEAENAMHINATLVGGVGELNDAHFLSSGHTAKKGVLSALLAKAGATGSYSFETGGIWANMMAQGKTNLDLLTADLGNAPWWINEVNIKKYSACTYSHTSIDALGLLMQENNIKFDDIEYVETKISDMAKRAVGEKEIPGSLLEARFSLHYLLGEVMLRGAVDVNSFWGEEQLTDAPHREAAAKVRVGILPGLPESSQPAEVTLATRDGRKFVKRLDSWIGSPEYPLTLEQIRAICRPYLEMMLSKNDCDRVEESMLNLEKQPDVIDLMDILTFCRQREQR